MSITYPPEMLPRAEADDEVEIFVCGKQMDYPPDILAKAKELAGEIDSCFSVYDDSASLDYEAATDIIAFALLEERRAALDRNFSIV